MNKNLNKALEHLRRVMEPTDDGDVYLYGFYCLECAVCAVAEQYNLAYKRNHHEKCRLAAKFAIEYSLPDVSGLLVHLNEARKAEAYGDSYVEDMNVETIQQEVESYFESVRMLLSNG